MVQTTCRKDLAPFVHPGPDANLPIANRPADFSPRHTTLARTIYIALGIFGNEFDMLPACKHGCGCLALLENALGTWSTTAAWNALTAGPKQTTAFRMISHLYYDLNQGGLGCFCCLASELELARVLATLPIPTWLGPDARASDKEQHLVLRTPTLHRAKSGFGALCGGRGR
jgi:hypothetical protein